MDAAISVTENLVKPAVDSFIGTAVDSIIGKVYINYVTSSFNMWESPCHLALFDSINERSFKMFENIIKNPNIIYAYNVDLIYLVNFVQKMKSDRSELVVPLKLIKEYIELFYVTRPYIWTDIFYPRLSLSPPVPKLVAWKLILEMLSQRDSTLTLLEEHVYMSFIMGKFTENVIELFFKETDHEIVPLLLSCSVFGNKRYSWLVKYWTLIKHRQGEFLCLALSNTEDIDNYDIYKVLEYVTSQRNPLLFDDKFTFKTTENLLPHALTLSKTIMFESSDLAWKCLYLLLSKSCGATSVGDFSENEMNLIESKMCNVCNECFESLVVISPYKLACAVNFIAMISKILRRKPIVYLTNAVLVYISNYEDKNITEDIYFEKIYYRI